MFESFGFEELTARAASVWVGLAIGVVFGILAQRSRFCLRRGLVGPAQDRRPALAVWLTAFAFAILGTQAAVSLELISFAEHRFHATSVPVAAIAIGGLLFGAGMVLTRGCVSRLSVLAGSGNMRAVLVLVVFAVVAHATLKGLLAPARVALSDITIDIAPAMPQFAGIALALVALLVALRGGAGIGTLFMGAAIGLLVPFAWVATGFVLFDEFDPIAMESLSFTAPATETLFWTIASSAVPAGFGVGLFLGVISGAALSALAFREFLWQSFESPRQTGRYLSGAALMGVGGVLAGGCSVGAGLAGVPSLSYAALLALVGIAVGAVLTDRALNRGGTGYAVPAE